MPEFWIKNLWLGFFVGSLFNISIPLLSSRDYSAFATTARTQPTGEQLYESGDFSSSLSWLLQKLEREKARGDRLTQAAIYNNLALVYSSLGEWKQANDAISTSLELLTTVQGNKASIYAQVLNTQGELQFKQGKAEIAIETWEKSERIFSDLGNRKGNVKSRLNQAYALQSLGFYRRSLIILNDLDTNIQAESISLEQVAHLRSLGIALIEVGNSDRALSTLQLSVALAKQLKNEESIAQSLIVLGTLNASEGEYHKALANYRLAWNQKKALSRTRLNARLHGLRSYLGLKEWDQAHQLWPELLESVLTNPATSTTVQAQLDLANSLQKLSTKQTSTKISPIIIGRLLSNAQKNAKKIGDRRLQSYALGKLGTLYENLAQFRDAKQLTQQALDLVDAQSTGEIAYQWQWQLGRILKQEGNTKESIGSYRAAVKVLGGLRPSFSFSSLDNQLNFRDRVEPLYREYVSLLLSKAEATSEDLERVRQAMESLQLAELDNFFRSACLDITPVIVDQVDQSAAVIYPIILKSKLAIVIRLPGKPLKLYISEIKQERVEWLVDRLLLSLTQPSNTRYLGLSQELYDVLLRPAIADIESSQAKTLVFIPDGDLRNIPLGVLHNGESFLIEDYAISISPGLQLLQANEGKSDRSEVLVAGLTEAQGDFPALPYVEDEVLSIKNILRNQTYLNQGFTQRNLEKAIEDRAFPIIHLATHGRFSSNLENTFLLTWGGKKIDISELRRVLRDAELRYQSSLELLVLSACETALGDNRAALGLAGISARSGAKSTLASLWRVNDKATAILMKEFYGALKDKTLNKAEILKQAQKTILAHPEYENHPYYWAGFILVGNWK